MRRPKPHDARVAGRDRYRLNKSTKTDAPTAKISARRRARSLLGDAGFAQAFEERLKLGQIRRVVAHRRPERAGAGDVEVRVEYAADPDCGTRLVKPTDLREYVLNYLLDSYPLRT